MWRYLAPVTLIVVACSSGPGKPQLTDKQGDTITADTDRLTVSDTDSTNLANSDTDGTSPSANIHADVIDVVVTGSPGEATVDVTIQSPDIDCNQYADWWEVLSEEGALIYRRILNHSHPDEQPFTRDGQDVPVDLDDVVLVRAHMNISGYGGDVMRGSATTGFETAQEIAPDFASALAEEEPLPEDCWF